MRFRANELRVQAGRRYRQIRDLWIKEGMAGVTMRLRNATVERIALKGADAPVRRADVMSADLSCRFEAPIPPIKPNEPLTVNWVTTPPSRGSGGHTTLFRIVRYLEKHGYRNRIYLYDAYGGDHAYYAAIVHDYYQFDGPVFSIDESMQDAHIVMATAWMTAFPIFNSRCAGKRFYFVQDFEPDFFPAGSLRLLAESTYRMGFHGLSIGKCFAERIRQDYRMTVETFRYGCDISRYRRIPGSARTGIVFYAKREAPRRGFEIGLMAIEAFAARCPEAEIHVYGDRIGAQAFEFIDHGHITPDEINSIYNRCRAGLSLSFTNVSLVALEMLAAGCIPVVNDSELVRTDLNNPYVRYSDAYPQALAASLEAVVKVEDFDSLSEMAAGSVRSITWDEVGAAVDQILRNALRDELYQRDRESQTMSSRFDEWSAKSKVEKSPEAISAEAISLIR